LEGRSTSEDPIAPFNLFATNAAPLVSEREARKIPLKEMVLPAITERDATHGVSGDFVLSELIRQLPKLTGTEALPLSQMITDQLRRWKWSSSLTFRRTKITEKTSNASVTIIDFKCVPSNPRQAQNLSYASTIVMSDIVNPETPSEQISCLWAPAYDTIDTITFRKESTHLLSVLRQSWEGFTYNERMRTSVAATAIHDLFSKYFVEWTQDFPSEDAALQRACAWGIVAANRSQVEYRLFATSLVCLLDTQINTSLRGTLEENEAFGNDICYTLIPHFKIYHKELRRFL
jgi:hypothetical protein